MSTNTDATKASQSSPNFKHQPIWLQSFLALFNCESVPSNLFTRAAQPSTRWDNAGELVRVDLNCLHFVHPEFERLLGQPLWSERFANIEDRRSHVEDLIERGDADADGLEKLSKESLLTILTIAASAFPEPLCEVIWEDVQEELWEVVESTCLPLLGVLDRDDMETFLEDYLSHRKSEVLFMLITFFIRVSVLLASRTPPNLLQLISQSTELFRDYVEVGRDASQEDLDFLLLSKLIAEILIDKDQLPMAARRLHSLSHNGSMRANAAIGFALGTLPTNRMGVVSNEYSKWTPILPDTPSTMEVLVQSQLFGVFSLEELSSTGLEDFSLPTRVLMGFAEARKKAFFNSARILEPLIGDVEKMYGKASLELLLIGTTLVNSFNATEREVDGEKLGRYFWSSAFGSFTTSRSTGPKQQTYLMVAISDSFLGQGKYVEARELLMEVLNHNSSDTNLVMSATLRLLKMSRRERSPSTLFEDWTTLGTAVRGFDKLSDILKYECIEETVCRLSVLEPDQMAKLPEACRIVKTLTDYRITTYKGSTSSRLNLHRNLEELKRFKNKLNLFSISDPQLSYCRKLRERFLLASVQIIEKVGSANWQRFKRIKEIREMVMPDEVESPTLAPDNSTFLDSGIGSSLKMDSIVPSPPKVARSVTSIRSFMSCEDGAMLLPPVPSATSTGERSCYICEKSVNDIENESQWKRHAFSDLRPYVCIVDDCVADYMDFASRAEFAAHLTEHQHNKLWTCTQCGHTEEKKYLVQDHINSKHGTGDNENRNVDIVQKSIIRDLSSQICPFYGEAPGAAKFVGHLCHHLEEISLSAIPRDAGIDEDDERGSSSGSSLSRKRIEEMFAGFDEPFDEIDMASKATRGFSKDEDSPSTPFPLATASQKIEHELGEQSKNRIIVRGPPQEEEQAPVSHGNSTVARDYGPTMDGAAHPPSGYSDNGLGTSVRSTSGKRAEKTAFTKPLAAASAMTMSAAAHFATIESLPRLSTRANNRITEHILKPLLAKQSLKDFYPIVADCPRRIMGKEIVCLRDLEKTLIFMAPERAKTAAFYLDFCLTSIRAIQATVEFVSDREQTRAHDRPYTEGYFVDLVEQIKEYASQVQAAKEKLGEMDPESTDEVKLHGGLSKNSHPAELVQVNNGKDISIATGETVDIVEDGKDAIRSMRSLSKEVEDDESILRPMPRRKPSALVAELAPKRCREPGCDKEFKRPYDRTKHENTHSRLWKCPVESCKYHEYGWATEKEMDCHYNDKHSAAPPLYECHFKPCPYRSKRESNCKQHMEKAHGWEYVRSGPNAKHLDFSQHPNDYNAAHPDEINQLETTDLYTSNVESSVADFKLFDHEDLYNTMVQLPYPGDFMSSTDHRDSIAIPGIKPTSYGNAMLYTPASLHTVDEGFENFIPTTSSENDFQLFSQNPGSTFDPSTMSAAPFSGATAQDPLDFYASPYSQHFTSSQDKKNDD